MILCTLTYSTSFTFGYHQSADKEWEVYNFYDKRPYYFRCAEIMFFRKNIDKYEFQFREYGWKLNTIILNVKYL